MSSSSLESPESFLMSGLQILIFEEKDPLALRKNAFLYILITHFFVTHTKENLKISQFDYKTCEFLNDFIFGHLILNICKA